MGLAKSLVMLGSARNSLCRVGRRIGGGVAKRMSGQTSYTRRFFRPKDAKTVGGRRRSVDSRSVNLPDRSNRPVDVGCIAPRLQSWRPGASRTRSIGICSGKELPPAGSLVAPLITWSSQWFLPQPVGERLRYQLFQTRFLYMVARIGDRASRCSLSHAWHYHVVPGWSGPSLWSIGRWGQFRVTGRQDGKEEACSSRPRRQWFTRWFPQQSPRWRQVSLAA